MLASDLVSTVLSFLSTPTLLLPYHHKMYQGTALSSSCIQKCWSALLCWVINCCIFEVVGWRHMEDRKKRRYLLQWLTGLIQKVMIQKVIIQKVKFWYNWTINLRTSIPPEYWLQFAFIWLIIMLSFGHVQLQPLKPPPLPDLFKDEEHFSLILDVSLHILNIHLYCLLESWSYPSS